MPINTTEVKAKWGPFEFWVVNATSNLPRLRTGKYESPYKDGGHPFTTGVNARYETLTAQLTIEEYQTLEKLVDSGIVRLFRHPFLGTFYALLNIGNYDKSAVDRAAVKIEVMEETRNPYEDDKASLPNKKSQARGDKDKADSEMNNLKDPDTGKGIPY